MAEVPKFEPVRAAPRASPAEPLVQALRDFIQEVSSSPKAEQRSSPPSVVQVIVLLLFVINCVLLASLLEPWLQSPLTKLAAKVFPAVLGGLLLTYLEQFRSGLLRWSQRRWFAVSAAAMFFPLLVPQILSYRIGVDVQPREAIVLVDGNKVDLENDQVPLPGLKPVTLRVQLGNDHFKEVELGRPKILWYSLATWFKGPRLALRPNYCVTLERVEEAEGGVLRVEGEFSDDFREARLPGKDGRRALERPGWSGDEILFLPSGVYDFSLTKGKCKWASTNQQVHIGDRCVHIDFKEPKQCS